MIRIIFVYVYDFHMCYLIIGGGEIILLDFLYSHSCTIFLLISTFITEQCDLCPENVNVCNVLLFTLFS